jgi:hypothetical protein
MCNDGDESAAVEDVDTDAAENFPVEAEVDIRDVRPWLYRDNRNGLTFISIGILAL